MPWGLTKTDGRKGSAPLIGLGDGEGGDSGLQVLTVRAGGGAAVGVVAESVDVHAALGVGIVARDVPGDGGGGLLVLLLEDDGALDVGVTAEDADWPRNDVSGCRSRQDERRRLSFAGVPPTRTRGRKDPQTCS